MIFQGFNLLEQRSVLRNVTFPLEIAGVGSQEAREKALGLLKVEWMIKARKFVIIIIFLVAAIVTPPDVVSQCMVAIPMLGLYQLSILICRIITRNKKKKTTEEDN